MAPKGNGESGLEWKYPHEIPIDDFLATRGRLLERGVGRVREGLAQIFQLPFKTFGG